MPAVRKAERKNRPQKEFVGGLGEVDSGSETAE
jgi:hypothetical protein